MKLMTQEAAEKLLEPMLLVNPQAMAQAIADWKAGKHH